MPDVPPTLAESPTQRASALSPERVALAYGALFAVAGMTFVAFPGTVLSLLDPLVAIVPGAAPLPGRGPSLWLGLGGAAMAMLAFLAFAAARDPSQRIAWDGLVLAKAVSSGLFAAFAAVSGNALFLAGTAIDGAILLHLLWLRGAALASAEDPWRVRLSRSRAPFHEAYFLLVRDASLRIAAWLRVTVQRGPAGDVALGWWVVTDAEQGVVEQGTARLEPPPRPAEGSDLLASPGVVWSRSRLAADFDGVVADLRWRARGLPSFPFVPRAWYRLRLAGSRYWSAVPAGRFDGAVRAGGRRWEFHGASGAVGHLCGRRMAAGWRWALACFEDDGDRPVVVEILSARAGRPRRPGPALTLAFLWWRGRLLRSTGVLRGLRNRVRSVPEGFSFEVGFGRWLARGECIAPPERTATVVYEDLAGGELLCRNCKLGRMRLELVGPGGERSSYATDGGAAVEIVAPRSAESADAAPA